MTFMTTESPKIGAFVLETLTTGMYTNPLDTIREYVQNSVDSIIRAQEAGVINENQGRIKIEINPREKTLCVYDNGLGVSSSEIKSSLIDIGMSAKEIGKDAGFRGIGRLAGIAYCNTLTFKTSHYEENTTSTVTINCEGIRKACLPSSRKIEQLDVVMEENSTIKHERSKKGESFFEVVMESLTEKMEFLDWEDLQTYLCQVAPVPFDAQKFVFAPKIYQWMKSQNVHLPNVTLLVKTPEMERQIFKPYKTHYKTKKTRNEALNIEIKDIAFYPETLSPDSLFWLWYGKTDLLGAIDDDKAAGLRLRKNNISLGGADRVREIFEGKSKSDGRFNNYFIGEIHVLSHNAIPNARRDGFEEIGSWPHIRVELENVIRGLKEEIRKKSEARNRPTAKVIKSLTEVTYDANKKLGIGFVSKEEKNKLLTRLKKEEEKAKITISTRTTDQEKKEIEKALADIEKVIEKVEKKDEYISKRLRPDLDRKQRKIVIEILQLLAESLEHHEYEKAKKAILNKFHVTGSELDNG